MFVEIEAQHLQQSQGLPLVICTAGEAPRQKTANRPNGFRFHHVLIVAGGAGSFRLNGETFCLSAGQGVFCRAGVPHAYAPSDSGFHTLWVTFQGAESVLDHYHIGDAFRFEASPALCAATHTLYDFCCGNSTLLTRSAAGYTWLIDWLQGCFAPLESLDRQVQHYLESHFAQPLTLDQIAEAVHRNRYALCHQFRALTGVTVMEQLKKIRMKKAKQLLRLSTSTVEEIGRSCGFESPSYFGKLFRQETGRSPREYRLLHQNEKGSL